MSRGRWILVLLLVGLGVGLGARPAAARQGVLLVHLPSEPVESAARLAEAAEALGAELERRVPGLDLEVRLFRRWSDAQAQLRESGDGVLAVVSEVDFLLDPTAAGRLEPVARFVRDGRETYRRILVVGAASAARRLPDLTGRPLTVVETSGPSQGAYLAGAVFEGAIDPATWFSGLTPVSDDATAAANVVYGQAEAALVAEHNPLLARHLGKELRSVYESPPLSLPVVSLPTAGLEPAERKALEAALLALGGDESGRRVLDGFQIQGLRRYRSDAARPFAGGRTASEEKRLELAVPRGYRPTVTPAPLPEAGGVPLVLAVELPDVPIAAAAGGGEE